MWDSSLWERARNPDQVCLPLLVRQTFQPGAKGLVAQYIVAVRTILADSLPSGRYRLTAQLNSSGGQAGEVDAGILDLAVPPT